MMTDKKQKREWTYWDTNKDFGAYSFDDLLENTEKAIEDPKNQKLEDFKKLEQFDYDINAIYWQESSEKGTIYYYYDKNDNESYKLEMYGPHEKRTYIVTCEELHKWNIYEMNQG